MSTAQTREATQTTVRVELYWLPLGAGDNTHCVHVNGRIFEAVAALAQHRDRCDLYHSALEVQLGADRYVIEMAPVWSLDDPTHGAVCEGPVWLRGLGRSRLFRYEVRRWRDGVIPDVSAAVDSPLTVDTDPARAARLLELVPSFPAATWGRDELATGDMWNSNSLISWLLAASGHDTSTIALPANGRAPGWAAGLVLADRQGSLEGAWDGKLDEGAQHDAWTDEPRRLRSDRVNLQPGRSTGTASPSRPWRCRPWSPRCPSWRPSSGCSRPAATVRGQCPRCTASSSSCTATASTATTRSSKGPVGEQLLCPAAPGGPITTK